MTEVDYGDYENVICQKEDNILIITIHRPEVLNCIDPETNLQLADVWNKFNMDDDAYVAIITGAGDKAFCTISGLNNGFSKIV